MSGYAEQKLYHIGEAARKSGVSVQTLRCYEKMGFIHPCRSAGGRFRLYTSVDLQRIRQVQSLKKKGLSLQNIGSIILTRPEQQSPEQFAHSQAVMGEQINQIGQQIKRMRQQATQIQAILRTLTGCETCSLPKCSPGCSNWESFMWYASRGKPEGK